MYATQLNDTARRRATRERIRDARRSAAAVLDARRERLREELAQRSLELDGMTRPAGSHS